MILVNIYLINKIISVYNLESGECKIGGQINSLEISNTQYTVYTLYNLYDNTGTRTHTHSQQELKALWTHVSFPSLCLHKIHFLYIVIHVYTLSHCLRSPLHFPQYTQKKRNPIWISVFHKAIVSNSNQLRNARG